MTSLTRVIRKFRFIVTHQNRNLYKFTQYNIEQKKYLAPIYRRRFFLKKSLFLYNTLVTINNQRKTLWFSIHYRPSMRIGIFSVGFLPLFRKSKKKKKTYFAGFESGLIIGNDLLEQDIGSLILSMKGKAATRRGIFDAFTYCGLPVSRIMERSRLAHNGTLKWKKRRL